MSVAPFMKLKIMDCIANFFLFRVINKKDIEKNDIVSKNELI